MEDKKKKEIGHANEDSPSPGLMKSDKPKSVAFKGESSLVDLRRKFCRRKIIHHIASSHITTTLYKFVRYVKCLTILLVSCLGAPNHVNGTQLQP